MIKAFGYARLGSDPELRFLQDGTPILSFRAAFNGAKKDADPTWISCSLFGKRAESLTPHLHKGDAVAVSGTLSTREYQAKDGTKRLSVELRLDDLTFAGGKRDGDAQPSQSQASRYGTSGHGASAKHTAPLNDGYDDRGSDPF